MTAAAFAKGFLDLEGRLTPILASLVYNTDCHCVYADYSTFEPIRIWAEYFRWVQKVPGWQDTKVPPGWEV